MMVGAWVDSIPQAITEGQRCDVGKTVFRYTDGKLRHYKASDSERVGSNWGAQTVDCAGIPTALDVSPSNRGSSRRIVGRISQAS
jgi:hypothetical protein